ncbi:MAG TPA: hypothetical protein VFL47_15735 [Flavisolibacter sp.]|nr:hypothetical protein [Flavisolibacter sp.]
MKNAFMFLLLCCTPVLFFGQGAEATDCFQSLFNPATKVRNKATIKLVRNKQVQTLNLFLANELTGLEQKLALKDLDGDGVAELVIYSFTGGAHCCDEFYFFKNTGTNRYTQVAKLFAGNTCVSGNTFLFDFAEPFGYFYTCYACELEGKKNSKGETYERLANISLQYKNGKLVTEPGTTALKEKLLRNLRYVKSLGWDGGVKQGEFDDGRRKALAHSLAVYYFSFGKNAVELKTLFKQYYPFKDAAAVWKDFREQLTNMQSQNSF